MLSDIHQTHFEPPDERLNEMTQFLTLIRHFDELPELAKLCFKQELNFFNP